MSSIDPAAPPLATIRDAAPRAAILLDFDGTLSPIARRPELARIAPGIVEAIAELVGAFVLVAVVSGRPSAEVERLVGVEGVSIEGLYGMRGPAVSRPVSDAVVRRVREVGETLPGSIVEHKGATVALHLRETHDPEAAAEAATRLLGQLAAGSGMRLLAGKRVVELVPGDAPLKDDAVRRLLASVDVDAALYAGDDEADLAAFVALEEASVRAAKVAVRGPETPASLLEAADLVVEGPDGMRELLGAVIP